MLHVSIYGIITNMYTLIKYLTFFIFTFTLYASDSKEEVSLQLKWKHAFQFAGFYMAKEKGYYASAGLDVHLKEKNSTTVVVDEVLRGDATFGISDSSLVLRRMQNDKVVALKSIMQRSPLVLLALKSSHIKKVADIQNKTVMMSLESAQNASVVAMLKSQGVDITALHTVPMSFNIDDLIDKKVDLFAAYLTDQPFTLEQRGIGYTTLKPSDFGLEFYGDILFTSEKVLKQNPVMVKKFVQASIAGWLYAYEHIDETIDVIFRKYNTQYFTKEKLLYEAHETLRHSGINEGTFGLIEMSKILSTANTFLLLGLKGDIHNLDDFIYDPNKIKFTSKQKRFLQKHKSITVSCQVNYAPLIYAQNGQCKGYAVDMFEQMVKKMGINVEYRFYKDIGKREEDFKAHIIDMELLSADYGINRFYSDFSDPYYFPQAVLVTKRGRKDIVSIDDLSEHTVALQKNSLLTKVAKIRYPFMQVKEYENLELMLKAVSNGDVDATATDINMALYYIKKGGYKDIAIAANIDISRLLNGVMFGIRDDWPLMKQIINKSMHSISERQKRAMAKKWFEDRDRISDNQNNNSIELSAIERAYLNQKDTIKVCVPPDLPPFAFVDRGKFSGMANDYIALFQKRIAKTFEVHVSKDMLSTYIDTLQGKCDMLIAIQEGQNSNNALRLTKPYISDNIVLATRFDTPYINDISSLLHQKIGVLNATPLHNYLQEHYPSIDFVGFDSIASGLKAVEKGKIFGFADSMILLSYMIQKEYPTKLKISAKFDYVLSWSLAIVKREEALLNVMQKVIDTLSIQEIMAIKSRWVAVMYERGDDYSLIWKIVALFLVILIAILYWNRKLFLHKQELDAMNAQLIAQKEEINHIAYHDALTNLPNRAAFNDILTRTLALADRKESTVGLLFIDLDRFKIVNDTLGHNIGDDMLRAVSQRIQKQMRQSDTLARIGGDEFVVILELLKNPNDAAIVANKILDAVNKDIVIDDYTLHTTASIGIALFPQDGKDVNTLLKNADSAMYLAKAEGKNNYQYYTQALSKEVHHKMEIEHSLRSAIDNGELYLKYQPQYELDSKKIIAVEALVRWKHPKYGNIPPSEFIPIAEDSGTILEIGKWIFFEACKAYLEWKEQGVDLDHIAINVSSVQFNQERVVEEFNSCIQGVGIEPSCVELEITERYIMEQSEKSQTVLDELRAIGFKISVDDFGTGYSSMSYLKTLPLDTIKIDKLFIDDIPHDHNDVAITKAILALAKSLEYKVVAEGIETKEQELFLEQNGCDYAQGYLKSRPISKEEFLLLYKQEQME